MALLEVEGLSVEIDTSEGPVTVVRDVAFGLERGEVLGLVGESGCGKSMTALAVLSLLPENARARGRVLLTGEDLLALGEEALCRVRGLRVAMIFQEPMTALNPVQRAGDQVAEGLIWHLGTPRRDARLRAAALLERVGLPEAVERYPHELSGGQRQRVVIALALACGPELLIADEPTTALDVTVQAQILDLVCEIVEDEGMGLLLITHDLGVIAETTDKMAVMYAGRIVEHGPSREVFRRVAHPYTHGLLAAMPRADGPAAVRLETIPGQVPDPSEQPAGCVFAERCAHAVDRCWQELPPDAEIGDGHAARCFFPLAEEACVSPPRSPQGDT